MPKEAEMRELVATERQQRQPRSLWLSGPQLWYSWALPLILRHSLSLTIISQTLPSLLLFKLMLFFRTVSGVQKNCKGTTEGSCKSCTQLFPLLTSYINVVDLLK